MKMGNDPKDSKLVGKDGKVVAAKSAIYGDCELSRPAQAAVYDNKGGKSTVAISVKLPILSCGMVLPVSIYARLGTDGKVKFDPALPKGVAVSDDDRQTFRAHVNTQILAWSGRERAMREAYDRLTAAPKAKSDVTELEWSPEGADKPAPATA